MTCGSANVRINNHHPRMWMIRYITTHNNGIIIENVKRLKMLNVEKVKRLKMLSVEKVGKNFKN